jgi:hypothetical protein
VARKRHKKKFEHGGNAGTPAPTCPPPGRQFSSEYQPAPENRTGGPNPFTREAKRIMAEMAKNEDGSTMLRLELFTRKVIALGMRGNSTAIRELLGRLDGPLPERVAGDPPIDLSGWSVDDKRAALDLLKRNKRG